MSSFEVVMRYLKVIAMLFLGIWLLGACNIAFTAEDSDQEISTVTLVIQPASHLAISGESVSETIVMDSTAETAFDVGFIEFEPDKPTLTVSANKTWILTAKTDGFTGPHAKPITDLQFKDIASANVSNGFETFKPLSADDQEFAASTSGVINEVHPCQYKILLDYENDIPGTYEATVTYTLSTNGS